MVAGRVLIALPKLGMILPMIKQFKDEPVVILVLCCNECAQEIYVQDAPKKCPRCKNKFKHGWDALTVKFTLPSGMGT